MPAGHHQTLAHELDRQIGNLLDGRDCRVFPAPSDLLLPETADESWDATDTVLQPDLTIVCDRRKIREHGCVGAPDLVIEILSPSTMSKDLSVKRERFERAAATECWFVSPGDESVLVFVLTDNGHYPEVPRVDDRNARLTSTAVPAIQLELSGVFSRARL
ncbi:MAG: Uma2 family endonuclease [Spirochaetia bacterium]